MNKYPTDFLQKTINGPTPLSLNDAREITENMTALFDFLITVDIKNNQKEGDSD